MTTTNELRPLVGTERAQQEQTTEDTPSIGAEPGPDKCDAAGIGGSTAMFGPYTAHPVAALFPLLDPSSDAFNDLKGSIIRNGLWNPIVLDSEGRILDGRNRYLACVKAYREPRFVQFADLGLPPNEDGEPVAEAEYAFDQNFARRDLPADQRAAIAVLYGKVLDDLERVRRGAPNGSSNHKGKTKAAKLNASEPTHLTPAKKRAPDTRKKAAAKAHVSEHKMQLAMNLAKTDPEALAEVAAGKVKLRNAMPKSVITDAGARVGLVEGAESPKKSNVPKSAQPEHVVSTLNRFITCLMRMDAVLAAHAVQQTDVNVVLAYVTEFDAWVDTFVRNLKMEPAKMPAAAAEREVVPAGDEGGKPCSP